MGLDISTLHNPVFRKPHDGQTCDDDWDTLTYVSNDACFASHLDGHAEGFYEGECGCTYPDGGHWSYSGYSRLRAGICRAAFGVEPEVVWADPNGFADGSAPAARRAYVEGRLEAKDFEALTGLVALIHFSDCEGAIGPKTCAAIAGGLEVVDLSVLPESERGYIEQGRDRILAVMRDAADNNGFALWH